MPDIRQPTILPSGPPVFLGGGDDGTFHPSGAPRRVVFTVPFSGSLVSLHRAVVVHYEKSSAAEGDNHTGNEPRCK
jgi:hypothetical protein